MTVRALFWRWAVIGLVCGAGATLASTSTRNYLAAGGEARLYGLTLVVSGGVMLALDFAIIGLSIRFLTGQGP